MSADTLARMTPGRGGGFLAWGWVLVALAVALWGAAPMIELRLFPIRSGQRIERVTRSGSRLCWEWISTKNRAVVSDNMDVFVHDLADGDRHVVAIYERDTGMAWARSRAVSVGPHNQPYCLTLPPSVTPDHAVRVEQTAYYPGWFGMWALPVHLPDVWDAGR